MRTVFLLIAAAASMAAVDPSWIESAGGVVTRDGQGRIVAVDLRSSWVTDSDLRDLAQLPNLATLNLSLTRITDHGMKDLKNAPAIADLNLYYAELVTDEGMAAVRGWKRLKRLNLRGTKITDNTLGHLAGLTSLESLDIGYAQVTDNGLDALALLPNLKELTIGGNKLTDVGVQFLRQLPGLTYLDLSGSQRTDSGLWSVSLTEFGLDSVATLKDLTELRLGGSAVTGRGLERLKGLRKLQRLSLQDTKRIVDDAAFVLASFRSLRWLDLKGTGMTEKTVAELRRQLPDCQILY